MTGDSQPGRRCGVLGSPIAHSLSPVLHRAAYAALGLDWRYDAIEVTVSQLAAFVDHLDESWRGLSLTMPLKQAAVDLCARTEWTAMTVDAVNTMVREPDGGWSGYNTDIEGCINALVTAGVTQVSSAVIVGAGSTARSVLAALVELEAASATVVVRSASRAEPVTTLAVDYGIAVAVRELDDLATIGPADVVVSTIPAAAQVTVADVLAATAPVVFDVVYHPARTPLLAAAERLGRRCIPGFELLVQQAVRQVELMTEVQAAPVEAMRAAGLSALASPP